MAVGDDGVARLFGWPAVSIATTPGSLYAHESVSINAITNGRLPNGLVRKRAEAWSPALAIGKVVVTSLLFSSSTFEKTNYKNGYASRRATLCTVSPPQSMVDALLPTVPIESR